MARPLNDCYLTISLLLAGCLLMGFGLWRGELGIYFAKAIRLCLECVGIG